MFVFYLLFEKIKKKTFNIAFEITQGIGKMILEAESCEFKAAALSLLWCGVALTGQRGCMAAMKP